MFNNSLIIISPLKHTEWMKMVFLLCIDIVYGVSVSVFLLNPQT